MEDKKVNYQSVDVKIKPKPLGYEIKQDDLNNQFVNIHLFKGKVSALDLVERGKTVMFRIKIQFTGNLATYLPIDAAAAKETIETIDLDLELLEVFFKKKETSQAVRAMFSPMVEKYSSFKIGQKLGTIKVTYDIFNEFVVFIRYLSYAPLTEKVKL